MQFNLHKTMNELEHHRRIWNSKQFEKLNAVLRTTDDTATVVESLQLKIQDTVLYQDFKDLEYRFENEAVRARDLHDIRSELKECVRESQIKDINYEVSACKKKLTVFVERDEMDRRHLVMLKQTQDQLDQRLLVTDFEEEKRKLLHRIDELAALQDNRYAETQQRLKDHDMEIDVICGDIKQIHQLLPKKLDLQDGQKIWRHFQRFAEYSDLKSLYDKCIPAISRFEERLIDFQGQLK